MTLQRIRLELARTPEFPEGTPQCGYELVAPLTADGHLDVDTWQKHRKACTVRRFWRGQPDETGQIVRTRRGRWAFSYAPGDDDDEAVFRLEAHVFLPGEYVSVTEHDGVTRPFRVASATPLIV